MFTAVGIGRLLAAALTSAGPWTIAKAGIVMALVTLAVAFGPLANGALPFALERAAPGRQGLAVGCWFGGVGAASAAFGWLVPKADMLTFGQVIGLTLLALGVLAAVVLLVPAKENDGRG